MEAQRGGFAAPNTARSATSSRELAEQPLVARRKGSALDAWEGCRREAELDDRAGMVGWARSPIHADGAGQLARHERPHDREAEARSPLEGEALREPGAVVRHQRDELGAVVAQADHDLTV